MVRALGRSVVSAGALVFLAFVAPSALAVDADYMREERWAREVVPSLVVGDAVYLATPARSKVLAILTTPAATSKGSVILVHGLGVHPDFGVTSALRSLLADMGYTTLSVQMPVLAADAPRDDYRATFPEAGNRLAAAIAYLRSRGAGKIAIVAHSVGAAMANAYLAQPDALRIDAFVPVGLAGEFAVTPKQPVLDVVAESELPPVVASAPQRAPRLPADACSRQVTIIGADHYFDAPAQQKLLAATIGAFIERSFAGRC